MYLMRFASFACGVYAGYKRSAFVALLAVSATLVVVDMWVSRKQLQGGAEPDCWSADWRCISGSPWSPY